MPTISKLPSAETVNADDLIPISQGGSVGAISVGQLLTSAQPAIVVSPPCLLGRVSLGPGGPEAIQIGGGLTLTAGTLSATSLSVAGLPRRAAMSNAGQVVASDGQSAYLVDSGVLRGLFTAGANIAIDDAGVISARSQPAPLAANVASLTTIPALGRNDLVAVNQNAQNCAITYQNLLNGLTIDAAPRAGSAADSDTFWVGQQSSTLTRQTLGALWPWIEAKLSGWKRRVVELTADTTLDAAAHNNAILVCSSPVLITASAAGLGSGFSCEIVNLSAAGVTLASSFLTSTGSNFLSTNQSCSVHCLAYSGQTTLYAFAGSGAAEAGSPPGQVTGLIATSSSVSSITVSWSAPVTGGGPGVYIVRYRVAGGGSWSQISLTGGGTVATISGLVAATSYEIGVTAQNGAGTGPVSPSLTAATTAGGQVPGAVSAIVVSGITGTLANIAWTAPASGGTVAGYQVQYRVTGQSAWIVGAGAVTSTAFNLTGLTAATSYDVQVTAFNTTGSGPASGVTSFQTSQPSGLVTSITFELVPGTPFAHGVGAIGVNAHVNPASAPVQFGLSLSSTTQPGAWVAAVHVNTDLWGQYLPTPASAGAWYLWASGTDGSSPTAFPTPITVT